MSRANFVQVQLAAAATDIQTTLSVKAPDGGFTLPPADGGRLVLTDSPGRPTAFEIITYTGRTGSGPYTLTGVTRGVEGTVGRTWGIDTFAMMSLTVGDLDALIAGREPAFAAGTAAQYRRGDKTWADLDAAVTAWWASSPDKTKLDGIAAGATVNSTDAHLLNRANHTGEQAISTVTGLQSALNAKLNANDASVTNAREWTADTVTQAEAETGTAITRRAWTAQRVRQAIVAWWNSVSSAWGRGFVSSADAAAGRSALGLGSAATATVQANNTDDTAGRLMAVGAFGLGRVHDLRNTMFELGSPADVHGKGMISGFARGGPDGLAIPAIDSTNFYGVLTAYGHWPDPSGGAASAWREFRTGNSRVFHQNQSGGAWLPWREVFHTGNILGPVSQSGGVPTGAIIQRGSNANGRFTRYADGTVVMDNSGNAITTNPVTTVGTVTSVDADKLRYGFWY